MLTFVTLIRIGFSRVLGSSDDSRVAFIEADVGRYHEALAKAQSTIKLKPDWPKVIS